MSDYIVTPFHTDCAACDSNADTALFNARAENLPSLKRWYGGEVPGLPELSTVAHGVEVTRKASEPFEHGTFTADAGDIGGDRQLSAAPSRQFVQVRDDGTYTVVTEAAYVVPGVLHLDGVTEFSPRRDGYAVENQTEIMHCRDLADIGGTEITCDYTYEIINHTTIGSKRDALAVARTFIKGLDLADYGDSLI